MNVEPIGPWPLTADEAVLSRREISATPRLRESGGGTKPPATSIDGVERELADAFPWLPEDGRRAIATWICGRV